MTALVNILDIINIYIKTYLQIFDSNTINIINVRIIKTEEKL